MESTRGPSEYGDGQQNTQRLRVGHCIQHRRLDKYLQGRFSNFSRRFMQAAIRAGHVKVNDQPAKPSTQLCPGDIVEVTLPEPEPKEIQPEDIPLDVIYEDDHLLVINKQAGIIVHPARGNKHGTLVNALVHYSRELSSGLGEFRPGIVHRLDRNTTGVMVVTKNDSAQWKIARQFEERRVEKEYLAVVHGTPELDADCIDAPLGVHPKVREKYAVRPEIGKPAVTTYEVLEAFRGFSVVKLRPKTGRTHQIRVHLSFIGHPIVADDMYGGKVVYPWHLQDAEPTPQDPLMARCALHAWTLAFRHPVSGETMRFEATPPADMQALIEALRRYRSQP